MLTRTKPQEELGTRRCMNPHPHTQRKHSELKEPYEMLNKAKTLTTIAIDRRRPKKNPKMNQSNWKGALQKPLWEEQRPTKCWKEQQNHKEEEFWLKKVKLKALKSSTWRTQTSGIFVEQVVLHTVNHRGPLPLKELHSTGETLVWRDPGGSWACLPPVYKCNHPATVYDTCGTDPKQHTKKSGALGNTKKTKITRRRAGMWVEEVYEKDPKGSIQNEKSPMKC